MIEKIALKNWKSHLSSELEFTYGTNALIGIIGSGKSSILDAICFALYGTFPALQSRKVKLDDVIMNKPMLKDFAEVELVFSFKGKKYSVRRRIERGKGTTLAELRANGKLLETQSTRVNELIEKILDTDYELFSKVIYSEQNSLDYFLRLPKGQRIKKIDELLMIEKLEKARSSLVTLINRVIAHKDSLESIYKTMDIESLNKKLESVTEKIQKIKLRTQEIKQQISKLQQTKKQIEEVISKTKEKKERLNAYEIKFNEVLALIREKKSLVSKLEHQIAGYDINLLKEKYQQLLEELEKKEKSYDELLKQKEDFQQKISSLTSSKSFLEEELEKLKKQLEEKEKSKQELAKIKKIYPMIDKQLEEKREVVEQISGKINFLINKIREIEDNLSKLEEAKAKCPICGSVLTEEHKAMLKAERNKQLETFRKELSELTNRKTLEERELKFIEETIKKLIQLEEQIKGMTDLEAKILEIEKKLKEIVGSAKEVANKLENIMLELEKLKADIKKLEKEKIEYEKIIEKAAEYAQTKTEIENLLKEKQSLESKIEELRKEVQKINLEEMENSLKQTISLLASLKTEAIKLDEELKEKQTTQQEIKQQISKLQQTKKQIEELQKAASNLKILEKALKLTQTQLREEFVNFINLEMNKIWETLYPYGDYVAIKLGIEEGDYVLQLQDKAGRWVDVDGNVSGGERSLAALTLRIALASVLAPQLKILVLDEPTHNLDKKAVEDLARTLRETIAEYMEQVFIITHDEKMEDAITGNAYLLARNKARDEPTRIRKL